MKSAGRAQRPLSLLLIAVDGLRADRLGAYGSPAGLTPRLDARARGAVLFERAVAAASWTLPSFASLFSGLPPRLHGAHASDSVFPDDRPLLAEVLARRGYRTAAFVGGPFLDASHGLSRGFSDFDGCGFGRFRRFETTAVRAADWLRGARAQEPFFLFVHGNDLHPPYVPLRPEQGEPRHLRESYPIDYAFIATYNAGRAVDQFLGAAPSAAYRASVEAFRRDPAALRRLIALHDERVARVDDAVDGLLAALERRGRAEDTVVALLSDHGFDFAEHGGLYCGFHLSLSREVTRVPLLVWHPRLPPRRVAAPVSLCGLGATLLDLLESGSGDGLPGDGFARLARGLAPPPGERLVFSESSLIQPGAALRLRSVEDERWKLILDARAAARLYDLGADPDERRDVSRERPRETRRLLKALEEGPTSTREDA